MDPVTPLQTPDILLLILSFLSPHTLLSFRLTSPLINSLIITHQKSICSAIASHTYCTPLTFLPSSSLLHHLDNLHLRSLVRLPRARLLAARAIAKDAALGDGTYSAGEPYPFDEELRRCTRGILVFWALVDIQRSVSPDPNPPAHYIPGEAPAATVDATATAPKRRGVVARLFRHRSRGSTATQTLAAPDTLGPLRPTPDNPAAHGPAAPSAATVITQRFATIKAAQAPFVALLTRSTRVDLELAQGYLHTLVPSHEGEYVGLKFLGLAFQEHCWWKESWALRQGPAFVLAASSGVAAERRWAVERMTAEWRARGREVREVERTTPLFLFADEGGKGGRPLWAEAWEVRGRRGSGA